MNIATLLEKSARSHGSRPALSIGEKVHLTYGELGRRVRTVARNLRRNYGLRSGERVAIAMTNRPEFYEALFAIWHAGLVAVPINAKLHRREFHYILSDSGSRLCFVSPDLADTLSVLVGEAPELEAMVCADDDSYERLTRGEGMDRADTRPTDAAWLFYTSGTTGRPKGATLTHRNLLVMCLSYFADVDWIAPEDAIIHAAPMSHGSGLYGLPHIAKAANNVIPPSGHFDPVELIDLLAVHRGASLFAAPTMIIRLVNSPACASADTTNLKTLVYGGGPMYVADLRRALAALGPKLVQIYGQGESPMTITYLSKAHHADGSHPRYLERLGSVGVPRTDVEVRIVDEDDHPAPTGAVGEVAVRGEVVMAGYWQNPEATSESLRDGWLHTGDMGSLDDDGFLTLKDRLTDMIVSGGVNIYPREVEEVLLRLDSVLEAAVVGRPHPEWGEEVVAFVVRRPGTMVEEAELDGLCLENIARFKRPKAYYFVDSLPKNNYGKVLKKDLRDCLEPPRERA